jgi:DeoR/GlpR family transcriptional regulator of sugar metabolism
MMLARQRQRYILESVQREGAVRVGDLCRELGVSDMTVRRDLDVLARAGLVDKVHGGATAAHPSAAEEPGFEVKWLRLQREKEAIARAAVELVQPGTAVGVSAGTTTWALAHELREVPGLTVVTNSIQVAEVLYKGGVHQTVVLTGGVRTPSDALVGPLAVSALRQLHLDVVFMGVHGMDAERGLMTPNLLEADVDRALVQAGRRVVVVADHTKWDTVGISTFAGLDEVDVVVTDTGLPAAARATLSASVDELVLAAVDDGPLRTRQPGAGRGAGLQDPQDGDLPEEDAREDFA